MGKWRFSAKTWVNGFVMVCCVLDTLMKGSDSTEEMKFPQTLFEPTGGKPNQRFACFYVFHGVKGVGWGGMLRLITFCTCTS